MDKKELREIRKQKFALMEQQLKEIHPKEDSIFYYHIIPMLDAFLQDDDYFSELLHYCNLMYEMLSTILMASHIREEKDSRRLAAISVVAAGFGGDMPEELATILIDNIDYHFNKVKCRAIEHMMPKLMKMVESEMKSLEAKKSCDNVPTYRTSKNYKEDRLWH